MHTEIYKCLVGLYVSHTLAVTSALSFNISVTFGRGSANRQVVLSIQLHSREEADILQWAINSLREFLFLSQRSVMVIWRKKRIIWDCRFKVSHILHSSAGKCFRFLSLWHLNIIERKRRHVLLRESKTVWRTMRRK